MGPPMGADSFQCVAVPTGSADPLLTAPVVPNVPPVDTAKLPSSVTLKLFVVITNPRSDHPAWRAPPT